MLQRYNKCLTYAIVWVLKVINTYVKKCQLVSQRTDTLTHLLTLYLFVPVEYVIYLVGIGHIVVTILAPLCP